MSNIAAGTTSTTALVATADTTGALVFQTGASATTAMTISSTQTVSFTNLLNYYTASLGADVSLTNTATYFDGPSVAQGTSGTWLVTAHVTVAGNNDNIFAKLWDGTTVVSSTETDGPASGSRVTITLNGIFVNPAGNIKISVRDGNNTTTKMVYNASGNSQDCNITAVRIA